MRGQVYSFFLQRARVRKQEKKDKLNPLTFCGYVCGQVVDKKTTFVDL